MGILKSNHKILIIINIILKNNGQINKYNYNKYNFPNIQDTKKNKYKD